MSERIDQYGIEAGGNDLYVSTDPAAVAEMAQWIPEGQIVRRRVTYSEWRSVPCTGDDDCLLHLNAGVHWK